MKQILEAADHNFKGYEQIHRDIPAVDGKWGNGNPESDALIRTYFDMGGEQLQPTVVSTETLRAARQDPGSHRDIIVKAGGYSAYFTDLGREIQDELISRTEHAL